MPQSKKNPDHMGTDFSGGLAALVARAERAGVAAPPVDRWNPEVCGKIDMVIRADGVWLHEGRPILREPLVRLFSSVLRKDADGVTWLVTPVEKLEIEVEDSPFLAVEMSRDGHPDDPVLTFRTNVGDVVKADADHPLRFAADAESFIPYVLVRGRLEARLTRTLAYDLAQWLEQDASGWFLRSAGARFALPEFE